MRSDACSCVLSHLTIDECIDSELTWIMIVDICCSTVEKKREYSMRISWVFCTHRSARYRCRACFLEELLLFPDRLTSEKSTNVARFDTEKTNWLCLSGQNKRVTDYVRIEKNINKLHCRIHRIMMLVSSCTSRTPSNTCHGLHGHVCSTDAKKTREEEKEEDKHRTQKEKRTADRDLHTSETCISEI